jgi:hypothetical protein
MFANLTKDVINLQTSVTGYKEAAKRLRNGSYDERRFMKQ